MGFRQDLGCKRDSADFACDFPFGPVIVVSLIQMPEAFERGLKHLELLLADS